VIRDVIVAVELIPGFLEDASDRGDGPLPHQAVVLARGEFSLFPNRVGQVEKDPPGVLARALELEDARFHGHILLAARFMDDADKPAAIRALMPWVRLGVGAQPDVAMAALRALTGLDHGRQRERWLVWFQDWERTHR